VPDLMAGEGERREQGGKEGGLYAPYKGS
jgi:hypothetical protein